jgi:hypothetical protein
MIKSEKLSPPNSLILIEDETGGIVPSSIGGSLIVSTGSCIVVGCRADADSDTEFTLGVSSKVNPGELPIFCGKLKTPTFKVVLRTVTGQAILELPVNQCETEICVWVNDIHEPDQVIVGVSE